MGRSASRRFAPAQIEPLLSRAERRAQGVYYTPAGIVRQLVCLTLNGLAECHRGHSLQRCRERPLWRSGRGEPLRILDPACGAGAMLAEAHAQLSGQTSIRIFGTDIDRAAVRAAQAALPGAGLLHGDALFDERLNQLAPFDAILSNPPYVNIRQLALSRPAAYIELLRQRFRTARGNFDLYVPFVERAWELLAPGGRCGLVLPNKWATLDYARPLRELLLAETTIEHVVDLSAERVFAEASVYPHLLVFRKRGPSRSHFIRIHASGVSSTIQQRQLSPASIALTQPLAVESRVETRPLGELATISCGTPGYSAQRVAEALDEVGQASSLPKSRRQAASLPHRDFITSGNIDRYQITLGNVRFLGRDYDRPMLSLDTPALTDRRRRLFAGQKIVVAGLSQRLEAAWDDRGLALGVQVFALSDIQVDPQYLLTLLNSKLLTYLFRTRFAAKRLAGGYLAINKGQLAQLPIRLPSEGVGSLWRKSIVNDGKSSLAKDSRPPDAAIDQLVYRLYRLTKTEIALVEAHFANLGRRAA